MLNPAKQRGYVLPCFTEIGKDKDIGKVSSADEKVMFRQKETSFGTIMLLIHANWKPEKAF